jgi:hypothetical protein
MKSSHEVAFCLTSEISKSKMVAPRDLKSWKDNHAYDLM